ncbi:hypothetical protein I2F27_07225 [Acinetobacter sp. B5B]|uniref:hypothetical protein n=1 Tax=Acinetobacter baretiae TaxID=2605383 RepID=UPI0018C31D9C|nr:hypothetical protein [Acinetobacter baretiae]MBF7683116.1 hypothetical protein [Acinetobacter baretiae]MBF7684510.1 hypothetical protein [Acinetobacter baretiae]
MDNQLIELLEAIQIDKEGCETIRFNEGSLFKVIHDSDSHILVKADSGFTFTLAQVGQNKLWHYL